MKLKIIALGFVLTTATLFSQVEPLDTDSDTYRNVSTIDHLKWINENSSARSLKFELDNDIDASDTQNWDNGKGWMPIGEFRNSVPTDAYHSIFEGHNYTISNLYINRPTMTDVGFFACIADGAAIRNLNITNADITGSANVGILVGRTATNFANNSVLIDNCTTSGTVDGENYCGGFVGSSYNNLGTLEVKNSSSSANVTATIDYAGGFISQNYSNQGYSKINNCSASGNISGRYWVGGFVGSNYCIMRGTSVINFSKFTGNVTGTGYVGGFAGQNSTTTGSANNTDGATVAINTCSAAGNVIYNNDNAFQVGGFCGYNNGNRGTARISNSYARMSLQLPGISHYGLGAFVGVNYSSNNGEAEIFNCCTANGYNSGDECDDCGIFCGTSFGDNPSTLRSYYRNDIGQFSACGIGITQQEMKTQNTFTGWDFQNIWDIDPLENDGYPFLRDYSSSFDLGVPNLLFPDNFATKQQINITLDWQNVFNATQYEIQISSNNQFTSITHFEAVPESEFEVNGLQFETTYYWRARALNSGNAGNWSSIYNFTTKGDGFEINLNTGWNLISSNVIPDALNMWDVFDIINNNILIVKNGAGQIFVPSYNINTIGDWNIQHGYSVYSSINQFLEINGNEVDPALQSVSLSSGWNTFAYLRNSIMNVETALVDLNVNGNLLIVKNGAGQIYVPSYNINTIGAMQPGQGYQVYIINDDTFNYPNN